MDAVIADAITTTDVAAIGVTVPAAAVPVGVPVAEITAAAVLAVTLVGIRVAIAAITTHIMPRSTV